MKFEKPQELQNSSCIFLQVESGENLTIGNGAKSRGETDLSAAGLSAASLDVDGARRRICEQIAWLITAPALS